MDTIQECMQFRIKLKAIFIRYYLFHSYKPYFIYMIQGQQQSPTRNSNITNINTSTIKSDIEIKRDKKKKLTAFKTFLDNGNDSFHVEDSTERKKLSSSIAYEQRVGPFNSCKVCKQYLTNQSKVCQFCKDTVCIAHLRKRRRNPKTNKWTKICDHCEDRCLMQKYCQSEIKTEQSLVSEELILQRRQNELQKILINKKNQLQMARNKEIQQATTYAHEIARMKALQAELDLKISDLQIGFQENCSLQFRLTDLQKQLPPSLKQDFQYLQGQNIRISRDLVKYEKYCNDIVATRSKKQKDMYREYYQWQNKKRRQLEETQSQQSQCNII